MGDIIFSRLEQIAGDILDLSRTTFVSSSRWIEDLGADSMDMQELTSAINREWDIDMENHGFLSVEDTIMVIQAKTGIQ